jgi:hypothetical protein
LSTLTKIFVVLLVVFSIAFTMSTISFVAQSSNWRELAESYRMEAQTTDAHLRNVLASSAAEIASNRDAINAHIARYQTLEAEHQDALQEVGELQAELAAARAEVSSLQATAGLLAGELKVGQAGWTEQRRQHAELKQRNVELEKRNLDLSQRVNELTSQLVVVQRDQRHLKEQIYLLEEQNRALGQYRERLEAGDLTALAEAGEERVTPLTPLSGSPIRGRLTDVSGDLATISVGSADGVTEGMLFVIYRGLDYIGDLRVEMVEPSQAAGKIVRSRGAPRVGDRVADEARFGLAN